LAASEDTPGGVFVRFSAIEMDGSKSLRAGQEVEAVIRALHYEQDGYRYEANLVRPID
jgi:cold shock CspA family protein